MVIRLARFNTYLLLLTVLSLAPGCQTHEYQRKKQRAVLRVHLESLPDGTSLTQPVVVGRSSPIKLNVQTIPFLTEDNVTSAKIIETLGGYSLQILFDRQGTMLLEQYTASHPQKRLGIYSQFGEDLEHERWLGAPMVFRRIANGSITFTPDANLEEAEAIELGLNNHAKKTQPKTDEKP